MFQLDFSFHWEMSARCSWDYLFIFAPMRSQKCSASGVTFMSHIWLLCSSDDPLDWRLPMMCRLLAGWRVTRKKWWSRCCAIVCFSLLEAIRQAESVDAFKMHLMTHCYSLAVNSLNILFLYVWLCKVLWCRKHNRKHSLSLTIS